jgi:UDP-N-acetylglucosamine pyrophosphorylase
MQKQIVILAAGKGSRMNSEIPKPMQLVKDRPMLDVIISAAADVTKDIILVHSDSLNPYLDRYHDRTLVKQDQQLGTAHAVFCALNAIRQDTLVTVIYADHPFIDSSVINRISSQLVNSDYSCMTLASIQEEHNAYGRIVHSGPEILDIIEFKDLSEEQKNIKLCNSAVMSFAPGVLHEFLPMILEKPQTHEYYLTSIVRLLVQHNKKVSYVIDQEYKYSIGVNTQSELKMANQSNF